MTEDTIAKPLIEDRFWILSKEGKSMSEIGMILRDKYGVPNAKAITNKSLGKIISEFKVKSEEIAFIGDDVNDMELLRKVGFAVIPKDAIPQLKKICDYQCESLGGKGVLREIAELIFEKKFLNKYKSY